MEIKPDSHCPFGSTYLVTDPNSNMFDVNNRIAELEKQISEEADLNKKIAENLSKIKIQ